MERLLIIEDELPMRTALSDALGAEGYRVLTAADGETGLDRALEEKPDLILLDLSFPPDVAHGGGVAWDGFLIMDWLQRLEEAKHIPIVVITGGDPATCKDRALAAGATSFFHKPINNDELLLVVRQTLGEDSNLSPTSSPAPCQLA